jgi:hypothetical protein
LVFKPQIVCIPLDWHEIAVMGGMSYHDSLFSNIADKTAIEFWPFGDKKSGFPYSIEAPFIKLGSKVAKGKTMEFLTSSLKGLKKVNQ